MNLTDQQHTHAKKQSQTDALRPRMISPDQLDLRQNAPQKTLVRLRGGVDRPFLILVIILVCLGSIMVFSASYVAAEQDYNDSLYFLKQQLRWVLLGFIAMLAAAQIDYRKFQLFTVPFCIVSTLLLCAVPIIGVVRNGAKRWIQVGPISVQPSEVVKLALIMVLAMYISVNAQRMKKFRFGILVPYSLIGLVCFITAMERHLSATVIIFLIGTILVFLGGGSAKFLGGCAAIAGGIVGFLAMFLDYAKLRLQYWLHPELDASNSGYQLLQSLYAIGSGGILGVGLGNSRQKYLYLPESQNDFIFAIICEELGLVGAVVVIALFVCLIWRGILIAMRAPDTYSCLLVLGIIAQVGLQAVMNIAVVTGTMPVTGVSLPFFSYGGSSLLMLMGEMGMILAVSRYSYQVKK